MIKRILYRPETLLVIFLILLTIQFKWRREEWRNWVLSTDGRGYYAYLTAGFIYQDFTYQSNAKAIEEQLGYEMSHHYIMTTEDGKTHNKCFPGVAICMAPMFFIAYFLSYLLGLPLNGYSDLFLLGIQFSAISAAVLGFWFLKKTLLLRGIETKPAMGVAFLTVLGTNIYFYAVDLPSMGHIYSFMSISGFIYYVQKSISTENTKAKYIAAFLLGLVFLIRPTNAIVALLIPFLAGNKQTFMRWINHQLLPAKKIVLVLIIGGLTVSILPLLWYLQTGSFLIWSYSGEGFYWTHPVPHKVLFSFRNGAFIYSPIALIGLLGLFKLYKKERLGFYFGGLYFMINLYIISAWWTYYYGGGFGHRALSEHFVFSGILLAELFRSSSLRLKKIALIGLTPLMLLSVFQGYQMNKGILPYDYINADIYARLFLRSSNDYVGECGGTHDIHQFGKIFRTDYKRPDNYWEEPEIVFNPERSYGADLQYPIPERDAKTRIFLEVLYTKKRHEDTPFNEVYLVVEGKNAQQEQIYYRSFFLYDIRSEALNEFKDISLELQLNDPDITHYHCYIWNKGRHAFTIKNMEYRFHFIKP